MEIIDVTVGVRPGMVTYPGDPTVSLERVAEAGPPLLDPLSLEQLLGQAVRVRHRGRL